MISKKNFRFSLFLATLTLSCHSFAQNECQRQFTENDDKNIKTRLDYIKIMDTIGKKYNDPSFANDAAKLAADQQQYQNCLKNQQIYGKRPSSVSQESQSPHYQEGSVMEDMVQNQNRMSKEYLNTNR